MGVYQLSRSQLDQLKEAYLTRLMEAQDECPSYGELVDSHEISDEFIISVYSMHEFSEDDFW